MFEDFSRNRRFTGWLEAVARGQRSDYPEPETFAEDARAHLERLDRTRSEQRTLDKHYRELLTGLGELVETASNARPEQVLAALGERMEAARSDGNERVEQAERELETAREQLASAHAALEDTRAELARAQAELQREQRKLDPVLRYAYNLRRLVQKIHATGEVTPAIRRYIEELLAAGGVSVNGNTARNAAKPAPSTSTVT